MYTSIAYIITYSIYGEYWKKTPKKKGQKFKILKYKRYIFLKMFFNCITFCKKMYF